ncbi:CXCL2-like chemokine precursor [Triplophysa rosa]|uniref:CXCL2-like chemokine n=2 Tax=Triplophysa rosa TaxID=992332 RepID=A0A9W8C8P5_TRIRA|nr:CXCL2-like chemokine precursor [Triplophysa rosa]
MPRAGRELLSSTIKEGVFPHNFHFKPHTNHFHYRRQFDLNFAVLIYNFNWNLTTMAYLLKALFLLQLAVVCIQLSGVFAQTVPDRCWCLNTLKTRVPKADIEEFFIFPQRARCNNTEIILSLKPENTVTEKQQRCLSPDTKQAKALQICWNRKNTNSTRSAVKISECF